MRFQYLLPDNGVAKVMSSYVSICQVASLSTGEGVPCSMSGGGVVYLILQITSLIEYNRFVNLFFDWIVFILKQNLLMFHQLVHLRNCHLSSTRVLPLLSAGQPL